jgi:hypothetical protein
MERRLGVAEEHARVLAEEERVVDAGEARTHAALEHEHGPRLVDVDDRHAVDRAVLVLAGRRVDHVVGADDDAHVHVRHARVDVVHLDELLVGHVGLGEEHVHVAGHAAGHRVDGEGHLGAVLLEQVAELADHVLRLGDGHAVAGDEHDRLRGLEDEVGVVGDDRLDLALDLGGLLGGAEAGEQHVRQRAVHGLAHDVREDDARGTDQRAGHDQQVVVDREAGGTGREARVAVEQRDDDGHVGAADRDDGHDAEEQRQAEEHPEPFAADDRHLHELVGGDHDADEDQAVHEALAREHDGLAEFMTSASLP